MPYNQLTNLDYFDIRNALRDYLRANSDFTDYDFEGSVLSHQLDLLAYNTYYTAFNTNMAVNETFLDSATLRDNVVSKAKELGYIPRSITSPEAVVDCTLTISYTNPISTLVFRKGSGFLTTIDNNLYQFVLQDDYKASVVSNQITFDDLKLYEGTIIKTYYTVGSNTPFVLLQNSGIDTSTIRVHVYESQSSSSFDIYTVADNILTVAPNSKIFFVNEVEDENYKITFGDGIFGKALTPGNYIEVSYLVTSGEATNSARSFTFNGIVEDEFGNTNFSITNISIAVVSPASGGASIESIDKIKKNAPAMYGTQNRAVTSDDYDAIVRRIYPAVADIYSYGGEEAKPPEYGKVKVVIKPSSADYLTSYTKRKIEGEIRKFSVASVVPEIIDPSILFVEMNSNVYYQSALTNKKPDAIKSLVIKNIQNYIANSDTEKFNGKFRYSKFVGAIDSADRSIRSNLTEITMRKDFYPSLNNKAYYEICFNNPFDHEADIPNMASTGFIVQQYPNFTSYIEDRNGVVVLYRLDPQTGEKIVLNSNIGSFNYATGEIKMYDLTIIKGSLYDDKIQIRVRPKYNDIIAVREMFLDVDIVNSKFTIIQE
jgi:hypothetical protein